jgi:tRNA nucleotidyltransferase (CCA-adding enzyme)
LSKYGKADLVGQSFGVIKFVGKDGMDFDFSLPRLDSKAGVGHKDFNVEVRSDLTPEEAAARRDFTINAISYDPITHEIVDPYNGRQDLTNKILRHTSDAFAEDPLRVLRGMQFASRFGFDIAPETAELAQSIREEFQHLPKERIYEEFKKLVTKGIEPGKALDFLYTTGWSANFPEIHDLKDTPQDSEWHPEGSVDVHTAHVMNEAARIADRENLSPEQREVLIYAALAHDFAKPETTAVTNKKGKDRITSHGHEEKGGPKARAFLESIGAPKKVIDQVVPLVEYHLAHIHHSNTSKQDSFVKNLAEKIYPSNLKMLSYLIEADHSGRPPLEKKLPDEAKTMIEKANELGVFEDKAQDLLQGRDIMVYTKKGGPIIGQILKEHRKMILDHDPRMKNRETALEWLQNRMQREVAFINGYDVVENTNLKGRDIKDMLDEAWKAQLNGEFNDKAEALQWMKKNLTKFNTI